VPESKWVSAHIFRHHDPDPLLAGPISGLLTQLTACGAISGYFFLRYWEGGPHVRLRMRVARPGAEETIRRLTVSACADFMASQPVEPQLSDAEYAALAPALAAAEKLTHFDRRLRPAGSIEFIEYRPDQRRFGTGESLARAEQHLTEASALALAMIGIGRSPSQRAGDVFAMLVANRLLRTSSEDEVAADARRIAATWGGEFILGTAGFENHYAAARDGLVSVIEEIRAAIGREGPNRPWERWLESAARLRAALVTLDQQGGLDTDWPALTSAPTLAALHPAGPELILEHCAHLMCNRLGIQPSQEMHLRAMVARATADSVASRSR
jgi:hypothetical protein